jgi:hypothetical protein
MIVPIIPTEYKAKSLTDVMCQNLHRQKSTKQPRMPNEAAKQGHKNDSLTRFQFSIRGLSLRYLSSSSSNDSVITSTTVGVEESLSLGDSCCCRNSSLSSSNKSSGRSIRRVQFAKTLVTYIPSHHPTKDEHDHHQSCSTWIAAKEHRENRKQIHVRQTRLMQLPEYRQAIDYVKSRLGRSGFGSDCSKTMTLFVEEKQEDCILTTTLDDLDEIEALEILARGDWRGLERAALSDRRHMACFVSTIRNAYQNGMSDESIASLCRQRSESAQAWAEALGRTDAMAVEQDEVVTDMTTLQRLEL